MAIMSALRFGLGLFVIGGGGEFISWPFLFGINDAIYLYFSEYERLLKPGGKELNSSKL